MRWSVWSYLEIYCGYPTNHRMPHLVILHSIHIWLHGLSVCIVPPTIPRSVGPKTAVTYTFTQTPTLMTDDTSGTPETHTSHDSSIITIYVHLELLPFPTYVTGTICVPCHFYMYSPPVWFQKHLRSYLIWYCILTNIFHSASVLSSQWNFLNWISNRYSIYNCNWCIIRVSFTKKISTLIIPWSKWTPFAQKVEELHHC